MYTIYNNSTYKTVKSFVIDEDSVELVTMNDVYLDFGRPYQIDSKTNIVAYNNINGDVSIYEVARNILCTAFGSTRAQKAPEKYMVLLYTQI